MSIYVYIFLSGKLECGQILDVNMVNEPKEHVSKLKAAKRKVKEYYFLEILLLSLSFDIGAILRAFRT